MFAKLFKPKWQVGSTEQRLAAVEKFNPELVKEKTALFKMISDDAESRVRAAAVKRFEDNETLQQLLKDAQNDDTKEVIQRQLINILDESGLASMDESQLLDVALQHKQAKLRQLAAEKISKGGLLYVLARESKDKAVQRYVRHALKGVKEERAEQAAKSQAVDQLCETLEGLVGRGSIDKFFLAKYEKAEQQWQTQESQPSATQQERWQKAIQACAADFDQLKAQQEAERQKTQAAKDAVALIDQLESQASGLRSKAPAAELIQGLLNMTAGSWDAVQKHVQPSAEQIRSYSAARKQLEKYCVTLGELHTHEEELQAAINEIELFDGKKPADIIALREKFQAQRQRIQWPEGVASPALLTHWEQACFKLDQLKRDIEAGEDEAIRILMRKRRQLDVHIEKGELKIANRIHAQIHHQLEQIWGKELERQEQRLQPLEEKLQKLRDWQDYSTTPKKEELCTRMEELISTEMDALDRADAIKAMQEEWREQTSVNIKEDDPLWTRFQEAGHKAYEPCAAYYAKLSELKQENLQKRRDLSQQLEDYLDAVDWEKVDWRKLQTVLRTAREEWKQYEPVRFPEAKPVHNGFFKLVDQINEKLKGHWQENLEAKEELIKKAEALVEHEDLAQAIEKAIFLQKQWKEVGHTFRSREQKLWKGLRAACDAVFARRDEERKAERAEADGHIKKAEDLVAQMKALAKLSDAELLKSSEQAEALQAEFDEIELPEKLERPIGGKFSDARRSYEQQVEGIATRKNQATLEHMAAAAALCDSSENAVLQGQALDADKLAADWAAHADSLTESDKLALQGRYDALLAALEKGDSALGDLSANLDSLEQLAIELEVLMDVETPDEYRGERRAYQLDKMSEGLGGGKDSAEQKQEFIQLRKRWYATGAVAADQRASLQARLAAVCNK